MHSTKLINPHGRVVDVANARVESLLKQGFRPAPPETMANTAAPAPAPVPDEAAALDSELADELRKLTKADLAAYALDTFGLSLDADKLTKEQMVEQTIARIDD